ncbi:hypothetical protein [Microcystis aeruginosa]|uniref:Uncharacterized protein n=1 Tax=Microcystis aeruginosa FD4 TaxID=2686288 RepID=A0A857D6Y4_MICAE|nr:hypothetical protein [Microcystis aeruginosa]QGZ91401.1 hypothetical protein GQR42_19675 [Microcystis aeruginosa FD4]
MASIRAWMSVMDLEIWYYLRDLRFDDVPLAGGLVLLHSDGLAGMLFLSKSLKCRMNAPLHFSTRYSPLREMKSDQNISNGASV